MQTQLLHRIKQENVRFIVYDMPLVKCPERQIRTAHTVQQLFYQLCLGDARRYRHVDALRRAKFALTPSRVPQPKRCPIPHTSQRDQVSSEPWPCRLRESICRDRQGALGVQSC